MCLCIVPPAGSAGTAKISWEGVTEANLMTFHSKEQCARTPCSRLTSLCSFPSLFSFVFTSSHFAPSLGCWSTAYELLEVYTLIDSGNALRRHCKLGQLVCFPRVALLSRSYKTGSGLCVNSVALFQELNYYYLKVDIPQIKTVITSIKTEQK